MKKLVVFTLIMAVLFGLVSCGSSEPPKTGIAVTEAWVRNSPMMERAGAAYMVIENSGAADDKLLSATTDINATAELHETKDVGGKMEMAHVMEIIIPAGGQIELKPGGYHIMLMGMEQGLTVGQKINITLKFQNAGEVVVAAEVKDN